MSITGEVNGEIRRRFEDFNRYGPPGQYINLPHGFRIEIAPDGELVLLHQSCPSYPVTIGYTAHGPYRWMLGLNWDTKAGLLVRALKLVVEESTEAVPF